MAIKIRKANEPIAVSQLVVVVTGQPGVGKSTLGFSTHRPLLLDFDGGVYRAANTGDSVEASEWTGVSAMEQSDLDGYDTIVVDTAGRALDILAADIMRRNPKMGRAGALTLQGFGQLKSEFTAWLKHLRVMQKDVVLLAHASEERSGDDIIERLDIQGGSKQEIYKVADAMGRLTMSANKAILNFSPTDTAFGKNPGQLDPIPVPDIATEPEFLGGVIQRIKDKLNALTEAQQHRQAIIEEWHQKIANASDADAVNALVPEVVKADDGVQRTVKGILHKRAQSLGLEFDKSAGEYKATEAA